MGLSASQARFLCITARLSDNELEQQSVAFSKQRIADNTDQVNNDYLDALNETKYQVLTGYNGSDACYANLTYNQITGLNAVATGKQYLVKDRNGKVVVPQDVAQAYKQNNGDFNKFLRDLGYTQSNVDVTKYEETEDKIHDAWDKYLVSVGKSIDDYDCQHILDFGYTAFSDETLDGYATFNSSTAISESGEELSVSRDGNGYYITRPSVEARRDNSTGDIVIAYKTTDDTGAEVWNEIANEYDTDGSVLNGIEYDTEYKKFTYYEDGEAVYNSVDALFVSEDGKGGIQVSDSSKEYIFPDDNAKTYISEGGITYTMQKNTQALNFEGTNTTQRELYDYALSITEAYYNQTNSRTSENLTYDSSMVNYYKNIFNEMSKSGYSTVDDEKKFKEDDWFIKQMKAGNLTLSCYSKTEGAFVSTTIDDDESITEKEDTSAMAIAEQVYQSKMDNLENQDKQFDLQLNRLSSQHKALETELDAIKKVISGNLESFKTFSG